MLPPTPPRRPSRQVKACYCHTHNLTSITSPHTAAQSCHACDAEQKQDSPRRAPTRRRPIRERLTLFPLLPILLLAGCLSIGNEKIHRADLLAQLTVGTPKAEVHRLLGAPTVVTVSTADHGTPQEMWTYSHSEIGFMGYPATTQSIVITFERDALTHIHHIDTAIPQ